MNSPSILGRRLRRRAIRQGKGRLARSGGFTLIELLVVIAVIGFLFALVLAAVLNARLAAQRTVCVNNLHEIGMGTQVYLNIRDKYPPAWVDNTTRWMDILKPYVRKDSPVYQCPADQQKIPLPYDPTIVLSFGINSFRFVDDAHCFWYVVPGGNVSRPGQVILFADCTPGNYWCGGGSRFSDPVPSVDYRHVNDTFNAAYCDGHVESKTDTTQLDWDAAQ